AVEAAGVPWAEWRRWMRLGRQSSPESPYQVFRAEVVQAQAQGRLKAETEVFQKSPMLWLKHGPGREKPGWPGWASAGSGTVAVSGNGKHGKPLDSPEMQQVVQGFLEATEGEPPTRLRLATIAQKFGGEPEATAELDASAAVRMMKNEPPAQDRGP